MNRRQFTLLIMGCLSALKGYASAGRRTRHAALAPLVVKHSPDPCPVNLPRNGRKIRRRYVWYYRTEVKNNTHFPLRVIRFTMYGRVKGVWKEFPNIRGHSLDSKDFTDWYSDGDVVRNGWIPPGKTAVCDPNYHWSTVDSIREVMWVYTAVDSKGKTYGAGATLRTLAGNSRAALISRPDRGR
jgi:hypothetical protein